MKDFSRDTLTIGIAGTGAHATMAPACRRIFE